MAAPQGSPAGVAGPSRGIGEDGVHVAIAFTPQHRDIGTSRRPEKGQAPRLGTDLLEHLVQLLDIAGPGSVRMAMDELGQEALSLGRLSGQRAR